MEISVQATKAMQKLRKLYVMTSRRISEAARVIVLKVLASMPRNLDQLGVSIVILAMAVARVLAELAIQATAAGAATSMQILIHALQKQFLTMSMISTMLYPSCVQAFGQKMNIRAGLCHFSSCQWLRSVISRGLQSAVTFPCLLVT